MTRFQKILVIVLVAQVALILLVRSPFATRGPEASERVAMFEGLAELDAARVVIDGSDGETVELARGEEGWTVASAAGFPADGVKVESLLEQLAEIRVRRPVVSSSRYHEKFEVAADGFAGRIRVWGSGGDDAAAELLLGSSPAYQITHARRADQDAVFEIVGLQPYDVRPESAAWIDRQLVAVPVDRVDAIRIERPGASLEIVRDDDEWRLADDDDEEALPLDPTRVEQLIESASTIRLADAAGQRAAEHGLESPAARVTLTYRDEDQAERRLTILLGDPLPDDESKRYVSRDGFGFSGIVWNSGLARLFDAEAESMRLTPDEMPEPDDFAETPFG